MAQNEVRYKFTAEDSQFKKVAGNVGSELKKMAKDGTLGIAALSTAFYALGRSMQDTLNTMDQISKMSSKTGFSTESLSALKYAADLSGVSLESLEKSLIKLNKAIASNSPAFKDLGIEIKKTDGTLKDGETILMEMSDAFNKMEDGAIKTAKSTDLMGRSGADMIPLLNGGKDSLTAMMEEARKAGATFDEISAKQAERFNDAITKLEYTAKGFTQELVTALMPAIDDLSTGMETVSNKSTKLIDNISPLEVVARGIAMGFYIAGSSILWVYQVIRTVGTAIAEYYQFIGKGLTGIAAFAQGNYPLAMSIFSNMGDTAFSKIGGEIDALLARAGEIYNTILNIGTGTVIPKSAKTITDDDFWANRADDPKYAKEYAEYLKRKKDGGSGGSGGSGSGSGKSGKDKVELITVEYKKIEKKDAEYLRDKQKWEYENQNATIKERLKQEESYLLKRKKLWEKYLTHDEFKSNEIIDPAFGGKLYDSLTELDKTIKNNTAAIQEADNEKPKQLVKSAVKKVDKDKATLQQVLDATAYKFEILDMLYAHEEFMNVDNPPFAKNQFDALENEKNAANTEFTREAGYPDYFLEMDKKVLSNLDKKYNGYKEELAKAVTKGLLKEEELPAIQAKLEANKIVERERLEKNHADYLLELEDQLWEGKMNIWSNAMGALAGLFAENTLAYKAFATAQATMDAWVGANAALKLPFPLNWVQFASVLATGLGSVQKIWDVKIPAFAKGGLISNPTLGLMGEKGPEIIAPQKDFIDYTKSIQIQSGYQNDRGIISALQNLKLKASGKDLMLIYDKSKLSTTRLRTA